MIERTIPKYTNGVKLNKKNVIVVIGGQYGSEAKGKHIQDLCHSRPEISAVVRTGAPNAGHSMAIWPDNTAEVILNEMPNADYVAMQIIPCGFTAENVKDLYVAAGAQVILPMLEKEYSTVRKHSEARVYVDKAAMVQTEADGDTEKEQGMSNKVGSTSKGCGAALARRIGRRDADYKCYEDLFGGSTTSAEKQKSPPCMDVTSMLHETKGTLLVEGTQGCGLSLYHCGCYPYCTSRDTSAANWLAEAGLSPMQVDEIHMVCRTYPIRVAGNSGPMEGELDWSFFFKKAGLDERIIDDFLYVKNMYEEQSIDARILVREVCTTMANQHGESWLPFKEVIEFTTVTKLPRRIGMFDFDMFERQVMINRPTHVALEFCNYVTAEHYGIKEVKPFMSFMKQVDGAPIYFGSITREKFRKECTKTPKLTELLMLVAKIDNILNKWCTGKVTHLGISRDSTLQLY